MFPNRILIPELHPGSFTCAPRGEGDRLTELFVAMARAAGMKAYVVAVTNRDRHLFLQSYFTLSQFDDFIAIVNVNGKEQYFQENVVLKVVGATADKPKSSGN